MWYHPNQRISLVPEILGTQLFNFIQRGIF